MAPPASELPWLDAFQTLGIAASLLLSAWAAARQRRTDQVGMLLRITEGHRAIWDELFDRPALARVTNTSVDIEANPPSAEERLFVVLLTLHLRAVYEAERTGCIRPIWGLSRDIEAFFTAPIPRSVWQELQAFQDPSFRAFLEARIGRFPLPVR